MTENVNAVAGSLVDAPEYSLPANQDPVPSGELGKDAFLKLLVAQLKYQDPLEPSSSEDFIATTAQFTVVEKLDELTKQGANTQLVNSLTTASTLIGREVTATQGENTVTAVVDHSKIVSGEVILQTNQGPIGLSEIVSVGAPTAAPTPPVLPAATTEPAAEEPTVSEPPVAEPITTDTTETDGSATGAAVIDAAVATPAGAASLAGAQVVEAPAASESSRPIQTAEMKATSEAAARAAVLAQTVPGATYIVDPEEEPFVQIPTVDPVEPYVAEVPEAEVSEPVLQPVAPVQTIAPPVEPVRANPNAATAATATAGPTANVSEPVPVVVPEAVAEPESSGLPANVTIAEAPETMGSVAAPALSSAPATESPGLLAQQAAAGSDEAFDPFDTL